MTLPDHWLTPERVREIAELVEREARWVTCTSYVRGAGELAINAASTEIAAAALEWAVKQLDERSKHYLESEQIPTNRVQAAQAGSDAVLLRQLAKEFRNAK